ncbi:hypothetical protein LINGRAHAP2_LOCUS22486 [Linum grandiflorum]
MRLTLLRHRLSSSPHPSPPSFISNPVPKTIFLRPSSYSSPPSPFSSSPHPSPPSFISESPTQLRKPSFSDPAPKTHFQPNWIFLQEARIIIRLTSKSISDSVQWSTLKGQVM